MNGSVIEIIDPHWTKDGVILPTRVLVNGTDVGWIAPYGLSINPGGHTEPLTVTLELMPSEVRFGGVALNRRTIALLSARALWARVRRAVRR